MKEILEKLSLNSDNSVVIGSGILQALGIRKSKDIDLVVTQEVYDALKESGKFKVSNNHGRETLSDGKFEIGTNWYVLDKHYTVEDFKSESAIIDGVRYVTLDFLYRAKKSWLTQKDVRPKDVEDVKLMEEYLNKHKDSNISNINDFYCDFVFSGKINVEKVKETDTLLAFYHTKPSYETHIVIVPKNHVATLLEVKDMNLITEVFELVREIIKENKFNETNFRIITNWGSFQDSKHLHFHLVSGDKK